MKTRTPHRPATPRTMRVVLRGRAMSAGALGWGRYAGVRIARA